MPELPEVETVKEALKLKVLGKTIENVSIYCDGIIAYPLKDEFVRKIKGQKIENIDRYGKWLIFVLDDFYLLSHLRMEGKYFVRQKGESLYKHEHVVFEFSDNSELRYMDVRKFGKMHLILKDEIDKIGPFVSMGLEPWDKLLSVSYLKEKFEKKKLPIKTVLLDQSIIVGIGNIYANEILFLAHIHPLKKAGELNDREIHNIILYTKKVMDEAIKKGGTTIRSYTSVDGVHGLFQQELYVHGREEQKCKICGSDIVKIKVGGRGTYFCPKCQENR